MRHLLMRAAEAAALRLSVFAHLQVLLISKFKRIAGKLDPRVTHTQTFIVTYQIFNRASEQQTIKAVTSLFCQSLL